MSDAPVHARMRGDWNRRAIEDAHYYAGFGRRGQSEAEFLSSADYVIEKLEPELARLSINANRRAWRALEIGCGPGRLMLPLSRHFGEIHGVDVSDEMVALARERLAGIPNAHVHRTDGAGLSKFADESFDFIYSYAVFQHVPDREVILDSLREIRRVLKPGGIFRGQFNDLPQSADEAPDTWAGCRFSSGDIRAFTHENELDLLDLSGSDTQYMWTTWRKRGAGQARESLPPLKVRRVTNAVSTEPVVTTAGRFSAMSLWIEGLPPDCELNGIEAWLCGREAMPFYVGSSIYDGVRPQLGIAMPPGMSAGLHELFIRWKATNLLRAMVRVLPPPPPLPRVISVTDAVNIASDGPVTCGVVKVITEEMADPALFSAFVSGCAVEKQNGFLADPAPPRHEFDLTLPAGIEQGAHTLEIRYGHRRFVFSITIG
jgi:SAM-dependent methyltransferase